MNTLYIACNWRTADQASLNSGQNILATLSSAVVGCTEIIEKYSLEH